MLGMQEASMKLTESLHEVYEPDWYGREDVKMVGEVRAGHSAWEAQGGFPAGPTVSYSLNLSPLSTSWPSSGGDTVYPEGAVQLRHPD